MSIVSQRILSIQNKYTSPYLTFKFNLHSRMKIPKPEHWMYNRIFFNSALIDNTLQTYKYDLKLGLQIRILQYVCRLLLLRIKDALVIRVRVNFVKQFIQEDCLPRIEVSFEKIMSQKIKLCSDVLSANRIYLIALTFNKCADYTDRICNVLFRIRSHWLLCFALDVDELGFDICHGC